MANNYELATVQPCIPNSLVSCWDRALLGAYGFSCEETGTGEYYFYAEDGVLGDSRDLDIDFGDFQLGAENDFEKDILASIEAGDQLPSYETVFQHMIEKSRIANTENPILTEIVIMAAYTCSKMRMGEFGGWVNRITEKRIQFECCDSMLAKMRLETELRE